MGLFLWTHILVRVARKHCNSTLNYAQNVRHFDILQQNTGSQILSLFTSHLYGVKVFHGTTQEESEEDQSEEENPDDSEYDEEYPEDTDYTKSFHKNIKPEQEGFRHIEPLDISRFFQDVDNGKYNHKMDPRESESMHFPDFFEQANQAAAATNTLDEIVEKEIDVHIGPAMTEDFHRLVSDINYDIDSQDMRRDGVLVKRSTNQLSFEDKSQNNTINNTAILIKDNLFRNNEKIFPKLNKYNFTLGSNYNDLHSANSKAVDSNYGPKINDYFINNNPKLNNKIPQVKIEAIKGNKLSEVNNNQYKTKLQTSNDELKEKIMKPNSEFVKKLNDSNFKIKSNINQFRSEYNTSYEPINEAHSNTLNSSDIVLNNITILGDFTKALKVFPLPLINGSFEKFEEEALKEFSIEFRENPHKRYASDAYFPENEDYYSDDSPSETTPSYDDYDSSNQEPQDPPKPKSFNKHPNSYSDSPYNPQNIPPSSSFAHMYRTFDNDEPISTHYLTNHDPHQSSHEFSTSPYSPSSSSSNEPFSNYKYVEPSTDYNIGFKNLKSNNDKSYKIIDVDGDSPDMEYQTVKEPKQENIDLDENDFDIDRFISDFNVEPPYSVDDEEGSAEEQESDDDNSDGKETDEGETESRPQEYMYKKTIYGKKPEGTNFEKTFKQTRSSSFRPKTTKVTNSPVKSLTHSTRDKKKHKKEASYLENDPNFKSSKENHDKQKPFKKCVKTTKLAPDGKKKMNCKLCENIKTGGKSEHCSFLINPNKDNYFVGTEEVTFRTKKKTEGPSRRKRHLYNAFDSQSFDENEKIDIERETVLPRYENQIPNIFYPDLKINLDKEFSRSKRQLSDDDEYDDESVEDDENLEAEYGPQYDPYFGEPVGYKSSDGGSCRTVYDDDGSECRICRNKKTNGEFKECSYNSKPSRNAYEYGSSKVYGSGGKSPRYRRDKQSRFRRSSSEYKDINIYNKKLIDKKGDLSTGHKKRKNLDSPERTYKNQVPMINHGIINDSEKSLENTEETLQLEEALLADIPINENRAKEEFSNEDTMSNVAKNNVIYKRKQNKPKTPIDQGPSSNEGGELKSDVNTTENEYYHQNGKGESFDEELAESRFSNDNNRENYYNDHFSQSFPELLENERESLEISNLKKKKTRLLGDDRAESLFPKKSNFLRNNFKSGLLENNGFKSRGGLLNHRNDFFRNNKQKIDSRFENSESELTDIFDDNDSENLNRMFGEFASKDRSNCKKRFKDKMTCYECVDDNNIRQEECIYIKNSEPKQVAYKETNQYNNPNPQSLEGHERKTSPTMRENFHLPSRHEHDKFSPETSLKLKKKPIEHSEYFSIKRPASTDFDIDIKKKNPKQRLFKQLSFDDSNDGEEIETIPHLDIQKVIPSKSSKSFGNRREQFSSGSTNIENVKSPPRQKTYPTARSTERDSDIESNEQSIITSNQTDANVVDDAQVEASQMSDIENNPYDSEDIVEPDTEGPDGAFSDETEPIFDAERGIQLPRYMVEKSEGERIFDEISG